MPFKEPGGSLPPLHKLAIDLNLQQDIHSPGSQPTSLKSILILSSHLRLGLPKGLFPSGFPTKTLSISGLLHTCYVSCPSQSS